jgi:hypothetical protein
MKSVMPDIPGVTPDARKKPDGSRKASGPIAIVGKAKKGRSMKIEVKVGAIHYHGPGRYRTEK